MESVCALKALIAPKYPGFTMFYVLPLKNNLLDFTCNSFYLSFIFYFILYSKNIQAYYRKLKNTEKHQGEKKNCNLSLKDK